MIPRLRSPISPWDLLAAFVSSGDSTERFERAFAERFGFPYALFFPYGRSALHALLTALGSRDCEVWCPAYTCVVVPHAVVMSGNQVHFLDSAVDHFLVPADHWLAIGDSRPTVAILTPLFGYPIDRSACESAVRRHNPNSFILYDVAQGFDAEDANDSQCATADGALYSLGIGKMISTLYGGVLTLRDEALWRDVRELRDQTYEAPARTRNVALLAYGLAAWGAFREPALSLTDVLERRTRLLDPLTVYYYGTGGPSLPRDAAVQSTDLQARLGLRQLSRYPDFLKARREIGRYYEESLAAEGLKPFGHASPPTYSVFPLWVADRPGVLACLRKQGVQAGVLIDYACPDLPGYEAHRGTCPRASRLGAGMINLPNWPGLSRRQAAKVVDAVLRCRDAAPSTFAPGESLAV